MQLLLSAKTCLYQLPDTSILNVYYFNDCLQCFDTVDWAVGTEWWDAGMVIYPARGADLHMAQLMPLPLTVSCSSKFRLLFTFLVIPFSYQLTRVVPEYPDKIQRP